MPLPDFNPPVPGSRLRSVTSWRNWRPSKIQTFVNCCRIMVPGEIVRWIRAFTDKNAFSDCYKTAALYNDDCCGRVAELNLTWTQSRAVYHVVYIWYESFILDFTEVYILRDWFMSLGWISWNRDGLMTKQWSFTASVYQVVTPLSTLLVGKLTQQ